jgi:hypothetical protein
VEHVEYVKWIIQWRLEAGLYLKQEKCEFHKETVPHFESII